MSTGNVTGVLHPEEGTAASSNQTFRLSPEEDAEVRGAGHVADEEVNASQ